MDVIYAVRDIKAGIWFKPFYSRNLMDAVRNLKVVVSDSQSMLFRFSEDYQLFELGKFDDTTGVIVVLDAPLFVLNIIDLKETKHV